MSIDITKISSLVNQLSNTSGTTKSNTYSIDFAEYLKDSMTSSNNTTIANDFSSIFQLNLNDNDTLKSTIEQALKSNTTDVTQLLNLYKNQQNMTTYMNVLGGNSSSSATWNDLFNTQSSQTAALQTYNSSSTTEDTIANALQSNFLSKQMNLMQTAYNKLQSNLEDYKERNAGIETDAVKNRIAEMTKNVSAIQTYMQEKLEEKASNQSLLNQLNANGQLASLNFK